MVSLEHNLGNKDKHVSFCSVLQRLHSLKLEHLPQPVPSDSMKVKVLATQSCLTLCDPMTGACQALLSMGFSMQEHWSGLPGPPPGESS